MYRRLLRSVMPLASGSSARSAESSTVVLERRSKTCSSHLECAVQRQYGITYSQWHHLRKAAISVSRPFHEHVRSQHETAASSTSSSMPEGAREVCEKYHSLLKTGEFKLESIVDFTSALCSAVYSSLRRLPWLHSENHIIAYLQILMNGRTTDLLAEPLYSCAYFQSICDHIECSVSEIPAKDCPSVLLSLLYSGLDQKDMVVAKLLSRCYDAVPEMNIQQVRDCAHLLQCLGNRDFVFAEKLVSRLNELLSHSPENAQFEIRDLCVSNPVLAAYMSQEMLERCIAAMLLKAQNQFPNLDMPTVGCCFRYSRKMGFRADRENLIKLSTLAKEVMDQFTDYSRLQSHQIAEVCHNAKRLGLYTGDVVDRMQERSLQLLRDSSGNLHIREITNLMFAFNRDTSLDVKQEISDLLLRHLEDADVLTLSNLADILLEMDLTDPRLITLFQRKVLRDMDNIALYITRLVKVLRLLRERLDYDAAFNHQVCEILLRLLNRRQGYDPTFVVVVAQFILPNIRTIMPAILLDCLMNVIPRCNMSLMLLILNGVEKMKGSWSRSLHNQVLEIRSQIQQNIGAQIENAIHASQLAELIIGLHVKSQSRDFVLLDRIMDHYPKLTKNLSRHDYIKTVQAFKRISHPYYHPEIFEDLIQFAQDHYSQLSFYNVLDLANIVAHTGYRPQNFDAFSNFMIQVLENVMKEKNYIGQISLAHYLAVMQIFPDHILGQIFTFDYLEEMDRIIEAEPDRQVHLRSLMMQLNRCVILECPHLDVPWFHQHYCLQQAEAVGGKGFQKNAAFVEEVEGAVREVMRGMECVGEKVHSPYFHPIDFEIVFDAKEQPIFAAAVKRLNPEELGFRRLAVRLIGNQQLCANSHRRRGLYLRDKRHLEILGYRVEEITRYDWNSMALSDWASKVSHVRSKIFPSSVKEKTTPLSSESTTMHPYWK
ncbi:uncharacterized protein LOC143300581 [Babylonia areolata]|uniref:uncharacterized protein LOC143300581 n=1 Tax=Babylonia areolata TaxID=304850 RepID=UPI003FD068A9